MFHGENKEDLPELKKLWMVEWNKEEVLGIQEVFGDWSLKIVVEKVTIMKSYM